MGLTNLMTCSGFEGAAKSSAFDLVSGGCIKARLALVFLFFFVAVVRKWGGEEIGLDFSFVFGLIGGIFSYILLISLFGSFKMAFGVALIVSLVFGYGSGYIFGGSE